MYPLSLSCACSNPRVVSGNSVSLGAEAASYSALVVPVLGIPGDSSMCLDTDRALTMSLRSKFVSLHRAAVCQGTWQLRGSACGAGCQREHGGPRRPQRPAPCSAGETPGPGPAQQGRQAPGSGWLLWAGSCSCRQLISVLGGLGGPALHCTLGWVQVHICSSAGRG